MEEGQFVRMQERATEPFYCRSEFCRQVCISFPSIKNVSNNRMALIRQMDPNLMCSAGFNADTEQ